MYVPHSVDRYVIAREDNVVRVDFSRKPDSPTPPFPGASSLRIVSNFSEAPQPDLTEPVSPELFSRRRVQRAVRAGSPTGMGA